MSRPLWQVEVFTAHIQARPEMFSHVTKSELRDAVYAWLLTTRPRSIRSGTRSMEKVGLEAEARVIGRRASGHTYQLEFEWRHPVTQQRSTQKVTTRSEVDYNVCPLESTHPILFDPASPDRCLFYRSQVRSSDVLVVE